jgi:hypothetical protein
VKRKPSSTAKPRSKSKSEKSKTDRSEPIVTGEELRFRIVITYYDGRRYRTRIEALRALKTFKLKPGQLATVIDGGTGE